MQSALSHNEIEILDHQVASMSYQLSQIAGLLESRLGQSNELASAARGVQQEFASSLHNSLRMRTAMTETGRKESNSQIA